MQVESIAYVLGSQICEMSTCSVYNVTGGVEASKTAYCAQHTRFENALSDDGYLNSGYIRNLFGFHDNRHHSEPLNR